MPRQECRIDPSGLWGKNTVALINLLAGVLPENFTSKKSHNQSTSRETPPFFINKKPKA
jgi:hypothetical protein